MSAPWPKLEDEKQTALLAAVVFFLLWIVIRSVTVYPSIFRGDGVDRLSGADSYFHLRHAEQTLENYPKIARRDMMVGHPWGERGLNQGFYDLFVATVSLCTFGLLKPVHILTWLSPVCGGIAFLALGAWLWKRVSPWCGLLFGALICGYPGPLNQVASLGNGDHHAFEVLLATLLILSLHESLRPTAKIGWVAVPAALLNIFLLSWAGAPLHLFFVGLAFYAVAFRKGTEDEQVSLGWKGALTGALISGPAFLLYKLAPDVIPWSKAYNVFLFCGLALAIGYPILVRLALKLPSKARIPVGIGLLISIFVAASQLPQTANSLSFFLSPRSSSISEHGAITAKLLFAWYGINTLFLILTPLLLLYQKRFGESLVPLVCGGGLTLFWMHTKDFNYYAPAVIAAMTAYALSCLPWKKWTPVLLASIVLMPMLPLKYPVYPWLSNRDARGVVLHTPGMAEATDWLRTFKQTVGAQDNYGVVTPWDLGSLVAYLAKTPVGWSQTHSRGLAKIFYSLDPEETYKWLTKDKRAFRFILLPSRNLEDKFGTELQLADLRAGDVFKDGPSFQWAGQEFHLPSPNQNFHKLLIVRLFNLLGRDLGHYRLVFESPQRVVRTVLLHDDLKNFQFSALEVNEKEAEALKPIFRRKNIVHETSRGLLVNPYLSPDVRIFETVEGAVLVGKAKPQARVGAFMSLSSPYSEVPIILTWKTYADADGKFRLRVPYPTKIGPLYPVEGSIRVNGPYRFDVGGVQREIEVTEEQVQSGERIRVRDFPVLESGQ